MVSQRATEGKPSMMPRGRTVFLRPIRKVTVLAAGVPTGVAGPGWSGLRVRPAPFPAVARRDPTPETVPLPGGLAAPVERFYRQAYGERLPVIRTAVVSGRGWMRLAGVAVPLRFRLIHRAGESFRAYIELTAFGRPVLKVNEPFVDGRFVQEGTPGGADEAPGQAAQAATVHMWAKALTWFPAVLLTDHRVRWALIDAATALLAVPVGEGREHLMVRFDPATGVVRHFEAMKYRRGAKALWINGGWFDQGRPWAASDVEERVYNAPVDTSLAAKGA
jgi:hypothetical protein